MQGGCAALRVQLRHRGLQQGAVRPGRQHAGHGEAVLPAVSHGGRVAVVGVRHAHPADLDAAAVAVHKALGGVIIKACVQLVEFAQGAVPAPVTVDGKPAAAVDVLALDALGGHRQIPLPVQTEQVRALPHVAEGLRGGQGVDVGPAELIGAFQHQHFALVFQRAGTQHHVVPAFVGEHLGVPHMAGEPGG